MLNLQYRNTVNFSSYRAVSRKNDTIRERDQALPDKTDGSGKSALTKATRLL